LAVSVSIVLGTKTACCRRHSLAVVGLQTIRCSKLVTDARWHISSESVLHVLQFSCWLLAALLKWTVIQLFSQLCQI